MVDGSEYSFTIRHRMPVLPQDAIARVRLLRTALWWAGWLQVAGGIVSYGAHVSIFLSQRRQEFELVNLLSSGWFVLFMWIPTFAGWGMITVLLEIYELFRADAEDAGDGVSDG